MEQNKGKKEYLNRCTGVCRTPDNGTTGGNSNHYTIEVTLHYLVVF